MKAKETALSDQEELKKLQQIWLQNFPQQKTKNFIKKKHYWIRAVEKQVQNPIRNSNVYHSTCLIY